MMPFTRPLILPNPTAFLAQYPRKIKSASGVLLVLIGALVVAACSQPEPTPTPTPTATQVPSPTTTPAPLVVRRDMSFPTPDPSRLNQVSAVLSAVPGNYHSVIALDVQGLKDNPVLSGLLDSERLGIPALIPIDATASIERVAVAATGQGQITVMKGNIDVASLLKLVGGFGFTLNIPDPEDYRDHQVWDINILGVTLAVGQADPTNVIFSSGPPAAGTTAVAKIRESLDTFDGLSPGFLDSPDAMRLLERLPLGFATSVLSDCAALGDIATVIDIPGCIGGAVSAEITGAGEVTFYGLAAFKDEAQALAALEIALDRVQDEDGLPFDEVAVGQEEELIWSIITVESERLAEALEAFDLLDQ